MKVRILVILALAFGLVLGVAPRSASAAAYGASWQVAITYQNVGSEAATVNIDFYAEGSSTAISFSPSGTLAPYASTSLAVGSVSGLSSPFKGSAVLSSDQPVVATIVQFATGISNRLLSNGFSSESASSTQLVATVLKNSFNYTTIFSVQNAESSAVDLTVQFFAAGATTPTHTETVSNLPAGAARYFDAGTISQLGSSFSGSAVVTAELAGTSTPGNVVVTVNELQTNGNGGSAFEGTPAGASTVYMPSALCKYAGVFDTFYAVQNASSTDSVTFRVDYSISDGSTASQGPFTLSPGAKKSISTCSTDGDVGLASGQIGSATIVRTSGNGTLVAVGKVAGSNITSAFLGSTSGSSRLALPYVRWSPDSTYNTGQRQRAFIAIQNVGSTTATNVRVEYRDRDGNLLGTHTLGDVAPGAKVNSNPALGNALDACGRFGEYGGGSDCLGTQFGGGAIVLADSGDLAAVVRISTGNPTLAGEDYNGIDF